MTISYQDFIKENAARQPEPEIAVTASGISGGIIISDTVPTGSAETGSLWFNSSLNDSKIYVRYDNNWIGIQ
jgi:hypothetical protein